MLMSAEIARPVRRTVDRFAVKTYRAGERVFTSHTGRDRIFIVRSGWINVSRCLQDGRTISLALVGPNTVFLQDDEIVHNSNGSVAEALVDSTIVEAALDAAGELVADSPQLATAMISGLNRRITLLHGLVDQVLRRDTSLRLASTLLALAEAVGTPSGEDLVRIAMPFTHHSLANMIGSNRVTVTRKLRELHEVGLIVSSGRNTLLVRPPQLREYVDAAS